MLLIQDGETVLHFGAELRRKLICLMPLSSGRSVVWDSSYDDWKMRCNFPAALWFNSNTVSGSLKTLTVGGYFQLLGTMVTASKLWSSLHSAAATRSRKSSLKTIGQ